MTRTHGIHYPPVVHLFHAPALFSQQLKDGERPVYRFISHYNNNNNNDNNNNDNNNNNNQNKGNIALNNLICISLSVLS